MTRWWNLFWSAADGLVASPGRLVVLTLAFAFCLFWVISGLALSEGLRQQNNASLEGGADLFVTALAFGREAPIDCDQASLLAQQPGVLAAVPRIVGRVQVGAHQAVAIGLDRRALESLPEERRGWLPDPGTVRIGQALAARAGWTRGKRLLLEAQQTLVLEVSGVFSPDSGIASAMTLVMDLVDAQALFDQAGQASEILVYCRPGYTDPLAAAFAKDPHRRVQTRALAAQFMDQAYTARAGALMLAFGMALAVAIPLFLLMAEFGLSSRRREIAILKASGWSTQDVLTVSLFEHWLIALAGGALAIVWAWVWVVGLGAPILRAWFVPGSLGTAGSLDLPAVFEGMPVLVGMLLSLVMATASSLLSVWRSCAVSPAAALRA